MFTLWQLNVYTINVDIYKDTKKEKRKEEEEEEEEEVEGDGRK